MPRFRSIAFALLMALHAGGCASRPPGVQVFQALPTGPYTLAAGDKLRIIVFGQDNLSNIYGVDAQGRIDMPLIGLVPVQGKTTEQVAHIIEANLGRSYLREPQVTVEVDTYRPFFILGEVQNSGQYPYVSGMTVQTAVAIAGGFSPRANQGTAEITRQQNGQIAVGSVPLTYPVRPGDTIVIKERWF